VYVNAWKNVDRMDICERINLLSVVVVVVVVVVVGAFRSFEILLWVGCHYIFVVDKVDKVGGGGRMEGREETGKHAWFLVTWCVILV